MVEEKKALKFKGTLILLGLSLIIGAIYLLYLLPAFKERKLIEELSNRFFRVNIEQVEFMRIQNRKGVFDIIRDGEEWRVKSPLSLPTDGKTVQKVMDIIKRGRIVKVISDDINRAQEFGLKNPQAVLFLGYGGRIDELAVGGSNPSKTGLYAFAKGINAIFLIDKDIAEALNVGLYELRSKSVFSFDPEAVTRISIIRKKGEIELVKDAEGWQMVRPFSGRASGEEVKEFLFGVRNQRADEFYDGRIPDAKDYPDTINILFYSNSPTPPLIKGGEGEFSGGMVGLVDLYVYYWGTGANEGTVVYQKGMGYSGRLPRDFWNFVSREASYLRYRNLFNFKEEDIWRIKVKKDLSEYDLVRKGDGWRIGERSVDKKKTTEFAWFLKSWKADRLLSPVTGLNKDKTVLEVSLYDMKDKVIGTLKVYSKIKGEKLGYSTEGAYELYYATSDNLKDLCAVSNYDIKKIQNKEEFLK